ncbi:hypothetical protein QAD02_002404 [Eretmocerus hayati]|uniref:Uncharacterized protein n=1 Tax=Eretmocerus hayati TaxID=131215 RepID=A0ACC2NNN0_9HYME|nr:hypothetical protein QAD02_002404 [Eretmocerus hayati]
MTTQINCGGFQDMGEFELSEMLNADNDLTDEEVEEMLQPELPTDEPQVSGEPILTSRAVSEYIKSIRDGIDKAIECDPIMTRSLTLCECEKLNVNQPYDHTRKLKETSDGERDELI